LPDGVPCRVGQSRLVPQTKCVETQSKPFDEISDWSAAGGAGATLKAARLRGLIRTDDAFYREEKKYRKQVTLKNAMSTDAADFDITRYNVGAALQHVCAVAAT
jgi:hypothetical protein